MRPRRILEIGSGASTIWLATFAEQVGATYVSLEHDERFAKQTSAWVQRYELGRTVDLRYAPLVPTTVDGAVYQWYDENCFADIGEGFDLLIVDGPPEATGEFARFPALPVLRGRLAEKAIIVLDDIHRADEHNVLKAWSETLDGYELIDTGLTRTGIIAPR